MTIRYQALLELVRAKMSDRKTSDRKLRLFACACCRYIPWHVLDCPSRSAIDVVERYADDATGTDELVAAQADADEAVRHADDYYNTTREEFFDTSAPFRLFSLDYPTPLPPLLAADAECQAAEAAAWAVAIAREPESDRPVDAAVNGAACLMHLMVNAVACYDAYCTVVDIWVNLEDGEEVWTARSRPLVEQARREAEAAAEQWQSDILRDIFGNPCRFPPVLSPDILAWNDGTVPRVALGIYEDRQLPAGTLDTARFAILADALHDAGCENEELMAHCRGDGVHVRGCWAIDHILGKE
jgi:hypothetical protein